MNCCHRGTFPTVLPAGLVIISEMLTCFPYAHMAQGTSKRLLYQSMQYKA